MRSKKRLHKGHWAEIVAWQTMAEQVEETIAERSARQPETAVHSVATAPHRQEDLAVKDHEHHLVEGGGKAC